MKKYHATILVVEDDENDQMLILRAFRSLGVEGPVHVVSNGLEAISYMMGEGKYADRERFAYPTFIVTDLKMPAADGFVVLDFLKKNPDWAIIPTVVFSSSSNPDDVRRSYRMGASSFHVKPNSMEGLRTQLEILNAYWLTCEVPMVDVTGKQLPTSSKGKLGERHVPPDGSDEVSDDSSPKRG